MAIRPKLGYAGLRFYNTDLALHWRIIAVVNPHCHLLHVDDVAFLEIDNAVGSARQRHGVRRDKVLTAAQPNHQRTAEACRDYALRLVLAKHGNRVRAMQPLDRLLHRF